MSDGKQHEDLMDKVRHIDECGEGLNEWEVSFIASFIDEPRNVITERQQEQIERIYHERC